MLLLELRTVTSKCFLITYRMNFLVQFEKISNRKFCTSLVVKLLLGDNVYYLVSNKLEWNNNFNENDPNSPRVLPMVYRVVYQGSLANQHCRNALCNDSSTLSVLPYLVPDNGISSGSSFRPLTLRRMFVPFRDSFWA